MKKAFSLLELIIAIVIIGLIASIGIPKLMKTKETAQIVTIKKDVAAIISAVQSYSLIHQEVNIISEAITLNSSLWDINSNSVIFKDNNKECIIIELIEGNGKMINLTINSEVSSLCKELNKQGVISTSYKL